MTQPARPRGPVILGLDVGTTGVKAVAFDLSSSWRHIEVREYRLLRPAPGQQVQDPDAMLAAAEAALRDAVARIGGGEVVALALSTAMHGVIALDDGGRPLTPLVTWADARAVDEARALRSSGQAVALHRRSGTPVHPMSPLTKLMWFTHHQPALTVRTRWWVGLKDYLLLRLTGSLVTELSSASGTGLLDLVTRTWDPDAVALAGVSTEQLPPVLATTATLSLTAAAAARTGLPPGLPVVTGAGDGPLGNLGVGATVPGIAGLSLGTSGAVRMVVHGPRVDDAGALFCYAVTDDAWVIGGATSNGGIVVRWAGPALYPDLTAGAPGTADEAVLGEAQRVPAGSDGLVMLPYLLPERAPLYDPDLPGAFLGLRLEHTRAHLVRAAVEGVCRQLAVITEALDRVSPVTEVRVTGGAFRSALWRDVLAATLGRPLQVIDAAEGSALGAAALGLLALGRASSLPDAVAQLSGEDAAAVPVVEVDTALAAAYQRSRSRVADLVESLAPVAAVVGPAGRATPG